jgi:hypothetical protein
VNRLLLALLAIVLGSACHRSRTRAEVDAANARRRCLLPVTNESPEERAVHCAEWFVARQGYTLDAPVADSSLVVPEGIEWTQSIAERLSSRRGSLRSRAFGLCVSADGSFDVAFLSTDGTYARGVTMDARFGSLRMQHSNFSIDVVEQRLHGCRSLPDSGSR